MPDPEQLGKYFGRFWLYHDTRQFDNLYKTAVSFLLNLGYDSEKSKEIALHIKRAYELHGEIDNIVFEKKLTKVNKDFINRYKHSIAQEMNFAFKIAGFRNHEKLSYYHSSWWIDFSFTHISSNKLFYLKILWHLFILQLIKFGKLFPAICATHRLCLAGIYGHNERNKNRLIFELTEFWKIALKYDSHPFLF